MTQTTSSRQPAPFGPPGRPGPGAPGRPGVPDRRPGAPVPGSRRSLRTSGRRRAAVRRMFEGTPGRLRLAGIGAVLACLVLSVLGAAAFQARGNALADARADAAQLIRVQQIATELVKADSLFTNGYLAYGLESTEKLEQYDAAIGEASNLIAEASEANASDAERLAVVNDALTEYTARVASARANNSQGYQVATGYLRQANALLRGDTKPAGDPTHIAGMLPTLTGLIAANGDRVDDAYASSRLATWMLLGALVLSLGGLAVVQVWLARRTRRYLNVPLAAAGVTVLLVLGIGSVVMAQAQGSASDVYAHSYKDLKNLATARIQGYIAKSNESISLIYIGTGGPYAAAEKQYLESTTDAAKRLDAVTGTPGLAELKAWQGLHKTIYEKGLADWGPAAKLATTNEADDAQPKTTVNGAFTDYDSATSQALKDRAIKVDSGLGAGRLGLQLLGWIAIIAGILAAVAAWAGISQRLEEYR